MPRSAGAPPFDPRTALLVVDMQNDFVDPGGSLHVRGAEELPTLLNGLIAAAHAARALVAYTQDWHPARTPHFAQDGGTWPVHCVKASWGASIHPALVVGGPIVRKGSNGEDGYSGFTMRDPLSGQTVPTALERLLRAHAVTRIVIGGVATDYCVEATAADAVRLGFETFVPTDAIRAVDLVEGDGARAIDRLAREGIHILETADR